MITKSYLLPDESFLIWLSMIPINTVYCGEPRNHFHQVSDDGIIFAGADVSP